MSRSIRIPTSLYSKEKTQEFIRIFNESGEGKILKIYNARDTRDVVIEGDLSEKQKEILKSGI